MARTKFIADNINNVLNFLDGFELTNADSSSSGTLINIKSLVYKGIRIMDGLSSGGDANYFGDIYNNYFAARSDGAKVEIRNSFGGLFIDGHGGYGVEINGEYGGGTRIRCGSGSGLQIYDNGMGGGGMLVNMTAVGSSPVQFNIPGSIFAVYNNDTSAHGGSIKLQNNATNGLIEILNHSGATNGLIQILNDAPPPNGKIYIATNGANLYLENRSGGVWGFGVTDRYLSSDKLIWWSEAWAQYIRNTSALEVITPNFIVDGTGSGASYNTNVIMQNLKEFYLQTYSNDNATIKMEKRYTDSNNYSNFIISNGSVPSCLLSTRYLFPGTNHEISNYFTLNADNSSDNWMAFFDSDYDNNIYKSVYMYMYHPSLSFNVYGNDNTKTYGYGGYSFSLKLDSLQMQLQNNSGITFNINEVNGTAQAMMNSIGNGGNNQKTIEMRYLGDSQDKIFINNSYGIGNCYIELSDDGQINIVNNASSYSQSIKMKDDGNLQIKADNNKVIIDGQEGIDLNANYKTINLNGNIAYKAIYLDDTNSPYDLSSLSYVSYHIFICQTNAGAITLNLPEIEGTVVPSGKTLIIKNMGTNLVTVNAYSGQVIDGYSSQTLAQYESIEITAYYDQSYNAWFWAIL